MKSNFNTPDEFFNVIHEDLIANPQKTKEMVVAYQFEITGDTSGGLWYVEIDNGEVIISKGIIDNWDCKLKMGQNTFLAIAKKQLNPFMAFLSGRVQMKGNGDKLKYLQKILG